MGDERRNDVFALFIKRQFPRAKIILVVADGKGILARKLANKGFQCFVIENKPRFEGNKHPNITYKKGWFTRDSEVEADVIVGMHPDEATSEIIRAAIKNNKPFAVVPCCIKGKDSNGINGFQNWLKKLEFLAGSCRKTQLPISGKNIVLYKY